MRLLLLFYRSQALYLWLFSGIVLITAVAGPFGRWPLHLSPGLLLTKLGTLPLVWYLTERLRPHQYWLYQNLHVSPRQLWAGVVVLDVVLFGALVSSIEYLTA